MKATRNHNRPHVARDLATEVRPPAGEHPWPNPSHQAHRRLKALEREGVISGTFARLDPSTLGRTFETLVFVTMRAADKEIIVAFEQAVADIPHILEAQRLFGDPDYLLRIIADELPAFQELYDERIATLPGDQRLSSTLVMKSVVQNRPLPL